MTTNPLMAEHDRRVARAETWAMVRRFALIGFIVLALYIAGVLGALAHVG